MNETSEQIYSKSLDIIRNLVLDTFREDDMQIMLFGSRTRGDFEHSSDIDIGIIPRKSYDRIKLILLKDKLEDMNIPYKVDLVDISKVSAVFRQKVLREGKLWKS